MSTAVVAYPPPPAEFPIVRRDVPVWGEHIAPIGKGVPIDKAALERVVAASNERIADMGSYAPQIILHSQKKAPGDVTPPVVRKVVGCMGPFRVKQIGRLKPRWAITADLHYSKDFEGSIKDYPERSVEYVWKDDADPTDGRLDALALLPVGTSGALDLGLQYESADTRRLRYSEKELEAMTKEEDSPEMDETQLAALVEQLKPIIAQMVAAAMSGGAASPAAPPAAPAAGGGTVPYELPLEHRLKYEQALTKIKELEDGKAAIETEMGKRLAALEAEHHKTVRYQALERLRSDGYVVGDIAKEFEHYMQYDEKTFNAAMEHRRSFTPRVPQSTLPIENSPTKKPAVDTESTENRMKYSAEALRRIKVAEREGKFLDYGDTLKAVQAEATAGAA